MRALGFEQKDKHQNQFPEGKKGGEKTSLCITGWVSRPFTEVTLNISISS